MQGSLGIDTQSSALSTPGRLNFRSALVSRTERPLTSDLEGERGALGAHVCAGGRREDTRPGVHLPRGTDGVCGSPAEQPLIPPAGAALGLRLSPWNSRPRSAGLLRAQALSDSGGVSRATTGPFSLALAQQAAHLPRFLLDSPPRLKRTQETEELLLLLAPAA